MTAFVATKRVTMNAWNILPCICILLSLKPGFYIKSTGACRPFCSGTDCVTLSRNRVNFETAENACRDMKGALLAFQPEAGDNILDTLSQELFGDFWIGLRLPAGACSNLSAPMRGYKWTTAGAHSSFIQSSTTWRDTRVVCSPHCVSLSSDRKWTERPCEGKTDGYLCTAKREDACHAMEISDTAFISSSEDCSSAPCEHRCTVVEGGFECSCFKGFKPDSKNPHRCQMHCGQNKCPAMCDKNTGESCECPFGYLAIGNVCEDIDECSMGECSQECQNTFGSFVCSCQEGFVLKDQVKCIKATPVTEGIAKPASNNSTVGASSAATGSFLWIWILIVLVVVVLIFAIRFYVVRRQNRREQILCQQSTAPLSRIET